MEGSLVLYSASDLKQTRGPTKVAIARPSPSSWFGVSVHSYLLGVEKMGEGDLSLFLLFPFFLLSLKPSF